jgi:hypothetical protein
MFSRFDVAPFVLWNSKCFDNFVNLAQVKHLAVIFRVVKNLIGLPLQPMANHAVWVGEADVRSIKSRDWELNDATLSVTSFLNPL